MDKIEPLYYHINTTTYRMDDISQNILSITATSNSNPIENLNKSFASHERASCWSKKNKLKPEEVSLKCQSIKFLFDCSECKHEFETLVYTIVKMNTWCSYCSNKKLCNNNECNTCFNKSFASHERAKNWSTKNTITARSIHKNYSKKVWFRCSDCKIEFEATPNNITQGKWCKSCGYKSIKEILSMKLEEFIKISREKHGNSYDYSEVIMDGVDRPVIIKCILHGMFYQTPYQHYTTKYGGCSVCTLIKGGIERRYTFSEFVEMARSVHGGKYDYYISEYVYEKLNKYIPILCKIHGLFIQLPSVHLVSSCGCPKCGRDSSSEKQKMTNDEFIARSRLIYDYTFTYENTLYISGHNKVIITCREHGDFEQDPFNHLSGYGCRRCSYICCLEDFIKEASNIHNNLYDYSLSVYTKSIELIKIICKKCGIFEQKPNSHLGGQGCPTCVNKTEQKLYIWLKSKYPNTIKEFKLSSCKNEKTGRYFRFDFMIPELNIIIELDGRQHFKQVRNWNVPEEIIKTDIFKMQTAIKEGYKIIRIFQEDVFKNNDVWLDEQLLPEIISEDRTSIFISSIHDLYDGHISLLESNIEVMANEMVEDSD